MRLLDAIRDSRLFAHSFGDESWAAWRRFLGALFAEAPRESDLDRYGEAMDGPAALDAAVPCEADLAL